MAENRLPTAGRATVATAPGFKARILIVDADDDTRSLYREWFQLCGFEVVEAADGRDALTLALIEPPALIVTEIRLPFIDGYAFCEIMRRDHATTGVPILVVTGEIRAAEQNRAKGAGATAVLAKPTTPEQMLAEARRLLDGVAPASTAVIVAQPGGEVLHAKRRRGALSKGLARIATRTPPLTPPAAICPSCDSVLTYKHSHLGGVSQREHEQWDWYVCPSSCGTFEYRHRTRRLRRRVDDDGLRAHER
jgi:CheY-like chemotaxis protein